MRSWGTAAVTYEWSFQPSYASSERSIRRLSYLSTLLIGVIATVGAVYPPKFLQDLVVLVSGGLACAFLVPMLLTLYWPRSNRQGVFAAMLAGLGTYLALYIVGFLHSGEAGQRSWQPYFLLGLDPLLWGFALALVAGVLVAGLTPAPPAEIVRRFFGPAEES